MEIKVRTKLRRVYDTDLAGLTPAESALLRRMCDNDEWVEVLREITENYYDVKTEDGVIIQALSWYHLNGFNEDGSITID